MSTPTELDEDRAAAETTCGQATTGNTTDDNPTAGSTTDHDRTAGNPNTANLTGHVPFAGDVTPTDDAAELDTTDLDTPGLETTDLDTSGLETLGLDDPARLRAAVEAALFVSDTALTSTDLAVSLQRPEPDVGVALAAIGTDLDQRNAGIELRELAGGFRLSTRSDVAPAVERFLRDGQRTKLSQAALETLAVVAYRQPVTRGRIAAIRGVSVDGVIRTLLSRGLIAEVGVDPDSQAGLYATTDLFLDKIGLTGLDELPSLAPLLPDLDDLDADDGVDLDAF